MEIIIYVFLALMITFGGLGILYLVQYNKMQNYLIRINESESIVDEVLRERFDLIIRVENLINNSITINLDIFNEVKKMKTQKVSSFVFDRKTNECIALIKQIKKDYSVLEENRGLKDIMQDFKNCEEKIEAAKSFYNKYTSNLNELIYKFPSNIIAKIHGIKAKNYFDDKNLTDEITEDFKI